MSRDVLFLFLGVAALAGLIALSLFLLGRRSGARQPNSAGKD